MYRIFIGIDFNDTAKEILSELYYGIPNAKWVSKDNLHITLNFIGDLEKHQIDDLSDSLSDIEFNPFSINLKGIGVFPNKGRPKILWVGVENPKMLIELQKKIDYSLSSLKLNFEKRKFHSHVTIARLRETSKFHLNEFLTRNSLFFLNNIEIKEYTLFRSFLSSKGSTYQPLFSYPL